MSGDDDLIEQRRRHQLNPGLAAVLIGTAIVVLLITAVAVIAGEWRGY